MKLIEKISMVGYIVVMGLTYGMLSFLVDGLSF